LSGTLDSNGLTACRKSSPPWGRKNGSQADKKQSVFRGDGSVYQLQLRMLQGEDGNGTDIIV
jgi:hypothetical protein